MAAAPRQVPLYLAPYAFPAIRIGPDVRTHVTTVAAVTAIAAGNDDLGGRHGARPWRANCPALRRVRAARPGRIGAVPGRARSLLHVPGRGVAAPPRRGPAAFRRRRVRRVPAVRMARRWIRALPLHGLPRGAAGVLLVQGPRVLPFVWRASDDGTRRTSWTCPGSCRLGEPQAKPICLSTVETPTTEWNEGDGGPARDRAG